MLGGRLEGQSSARWASPSALTPDELLRLASMAAVIVALHLIGWITLVAVVEPAHLQPRRQDIRYRHRPDRLHTGTTTRIRRRPHSRHRQHHPQADERRAAPAERRVFLLAGPLLGGLRTGAAAGARPEGHRQAGQARLVGAAPLHRLDRHDRLSGVSLSDRIHQCRHLGRHSEGFRPDAPRQYDESELEEQLNNRGLLNRFLNRFTKAVTKSWHMYPVGILFGLGFDTATEVALLVLAGTGAAAGLPWYAILCLPVLFTAGMCLLDTVDGSFMNFAYGWALSNPVRKVYYNITITGLSVAVALLIGSVEVLGLLANQFGWSGAFWDGISGIDLNAVGFLIVGLFVVTWAIALLVWRYARIEEKWTSASNLLDSGVDGR